MSSGDSGMSSLGYEKIPTPITGAHDRINLMNKNVVLSKNITIMMKDMKTHCMQR